MLPLSRNLSISFHTEPKWESYYYGRCCHYIVLIYFYETWWQLDHHLYVHYTDLPTVSLLARHSCFLPDVSRPAKSWKCPAILQKKRAEFIHKIRFPVKIALRDITLQESKIGTTEKKGKHFSWLAGLTSYTVVVKRLQTYEITP